MGEGREGTHNYALDRTERFFESAKKALLNGGEFRQRKMGKEERSTTTVVVSLTCGEP